ncbi:MAG TPA: DUF1016 N-terminal domain-containing protein [Kofleriaceae bacterium]|nr:DUF1016 N-terminal domain-containing protein [Kofleriaceae bacterium]
MRPRKKKVLATRARRPTRARIKKVSALLRQLPWTHHLIILGQAKPPETREFYILAAIRERWSTRELERQIRSGAVLRSAPSTKKVSDELVRSMGTVDEFKNVYSLDFLGAPRWPLRG